MRVAIIDLGTNTFHLMLAEVSKKSYSIFFRERVPVKIGEKGINKGEITPEAWERVISALKGFKATIDENDINEVFGTATSAIRNASNGKELVAEIYSQTGIEIEIISGLREAELIHLGAKEALDLGEEMSLIMDIGGGSIEFIISNQDRVFWMESFEVVANAWWKSFISRTRSQVQKLKRFITTSTNIYSHSKRPAKSLLL